MQDLNLDFLKANGEDKKIDFAKMHEDSIIDLDVIYERPPLAISIGHDGIYPIPFGTFGNISLIKGEEKARKSFLKSLLIACAIGGEASNYCDFINGHDLQDKYIIDLDGEQDDYYTWLNGKRIPEMVGTLPDNYQIIKLREYSPKERAQYLEWLFMESQFRKKLGLVSLDGYVDFLKNFNDQEESSEFTQNLMKYSSKTKCHITGILHLNPGTTKARGHLGTILQQKCETVTTIKDMGDHSEVNCQRGRGKKFEPFTIRVNNQWLPYTSDDTIEEINNNNNPFQ